MFRWLGIRHWKQGQLSGHSRLRVRPGGERAVANGPIADFGPRHRSSRFPLAAQSQSASLKQLHKVWP
jgi:hypothetical protein